MKRREFVRHLERFECVLADEGAKHSKYVNSAMSDLNGDLVDLLDKLQHSLIQEYFGFVSDMIDDILEQTGSARAKLLALRDVMRKLGPATPTLANSTCDEIDRVEELIEAYLKNVFDA